MSEQKDIEEFIEIDKSTIEIVEGIQSVAFTNGVTVGQIKGECLAWEKLMDIITANAPEIARSENETLQKITSLIVGNYLDVVDKSEKAYELAKPLLKEDKPLKAAFWAVLKRRVKKFEK